MTADGDCDTPTTKRFPRTLGEAFKDATYADPVYRDRPEDRNVNGWPGVLLAIAVGLFGAWFLVWVGCK